jgi:hypothetical protein
MGGSVNDDTLGDAELKPEGLAAGSAVGRWGSLTWLEAIASSRAEARLQEDPRRPSIHEAVTAHERDGRPLLLREHQELPRQDHP